MSSPVQGGPNARRAAIAAAALVLGLGIGGGGGGGGGGDGPGCQGRSLGAGNGPGSKELSLVIGTSRPLTGSAKALGESGEKASAVALEEIRRAIGEAGADHTVRTVFEDQGSDPGAAAESARRLVDEQGASCLTGPWNSAAVNRTATDIVIPGKILEIAPVPTGAAVGDLNDHDLVNSTALPESLEGSALSKAIEQDLGGTQGHTVNVAAGIDSGGGTVSQDFVEDWQGKDGTVSGQTLLAPPYSGQVQQITAGSP